MDASSTADPATRTDGAPAADATGTRPTVVLVDDEPDLVHLMERLLGSNGFDVVGTAGDGVVAIETVAAKQPDVVVLDLRMPRLDGAAALPSIVREAPRTMISILSANLDSERVKPLLLLGAFTAYDKGDLSGLPDYLSDDLESFRRCLDGHDDVPIWHRRYRRL